MSLLAVHQFCFLTLIGWVQESRSWMVVIGPPSSIPAIPWYSVSVTFLLIIPFLSWDSPQFSFFPFLVHQLSSPYFSFFSYLPKISCVSKKKFNHRKHKNAATKWEKIFTKYIFSRGLISKICKELKNLNIKKTEYPNLKIGGGGGQS